MFSFFKRFARKPYGPKGVVFTSPLSVEASCVLVGDIHGRIDLLQRLIKKVDLQGTQDLIFLGDYIDRGDYSADVLQTLFELKESDNVKCLMGNHERMLLDFLDEPKGKGSRWLRNGGLQTLASFGIGEVAESSGPAPLQEAAFKLEATMGADMVQWLRGLPLVHQNGNLICVHAALDPQLPLSLQKPSAYLWGHPSFSKIPRTDGYWVAHGHTVVEEAGTKDGRISIDTGAYYTGRLTAVVLEKNKPIRFLDTK